MYHDHLYDTHASAIADKIVTLLNLCQQVQPEKDVKERPAPGAYSRDEDGFAERNWVVYGNATLLHQLQPMLSIISSVSVELESRGKIMVMRGGRYADWELGYLASESLTLNGETP